jgi:hypothetical protein
MYSDKVRIKIEDLYAQAIDRSRSNIAWYKNEMMRYNSSSRMYKDFQERIDQEVVKMALVRDMFKEVLEVFTSDLRGELK